MEERFLRSGDAVTPERPRRELGPRTRTLIRGLRRFALFVAIAAGVSVGLAVAIALWRDSDVGRAAALGLYLGGGALIAVPLFSWGGRSHSTGGYDFIETESLGPEGRRQWQAEHSAYLAIGVSLILIGLTVEMLL